MRYCICGIPLQTNRRLCHECAGIYGSHVSGWPEWLQVWMRSYEHELKYEARALNYETTLSED